MRYFQASSGVRQVETFIQEHDKANANFGLLRIGLLCHERSFSLLCKISAWSFRLTLDLCQDEKVEADKRPHDIEDTSNSDSQGNCKLKGTVVSPPING